MAKRKRTKGQTIYKTPHRKLKIEATRIPLKLWVIRKCLQFLLHMWHPSFYCYTTWTSSDIEIVLDTIGKSGNLRIWNQVKHIQDSPTSAKVTWGRFTRFVTRVTRPVPHIEQELLTLPSSPHIARSI